MFLDRKQITSNASRKIITFKYSWLLRKHAPRTSLRLIGYRGRSATGRIICWTKSQVKKRLKTVLVLDSWRRSNIGFFATFKITPRNNKLLALIILSCGSYFYSPTTDHHKVFRFIYFKTKHDFCVDYLKRPTVFKMYMLYRLQKISMLEIFPGSGIQYAMSAGCFAKIIKFIPKRHLALLALPSRVKKVFSIHINVFRHQSALRRKKRLVNTKSGYWRTLGKKPIVRGVAMNPIDHPHGGRTNTIKYPRTPWGLTTKYK